MAAKKLDVKGRSCPIPIVELMRAIGQISAGQEIEIEANDRAFPADVKAWCNKSGHGLIALTESAGTYTALIRKKSAP
jgi:tRNA 2-thiouridine synthesizing protein A